nr:peptidase domain-containing ABC transporter [Luteibacter rhizovicinus]
MYKRQVADFHGRHETLANLRQRFPPSVHGTTLNELTSIADALGLNSRAFRFNMDEVAKLRLPAILHWDMDHFVVLRRVTRKTIVVHDPAIGLRTISLSEASLHITGIALELYPGNTFESKQKPPPVSLRQLVGAVAGLRKGLGVVIALAACLEVLALLIPQFLQAVVDQVIADGDHDLLTFVGIGFILVLLLQMVFSAVRTWTLLTISSHFNLSWSTSVFAHLMKLPQAYFMKRHLGDIVSRFGAVATIQHGLTGQMVSALFDGAMSIVTVIILVVYSPLMAPVVVAAMMAYGLIRALYFRTYRESNLSQISTQAKQQSLFMESVRASQTIRLFNAVPAQTSRFANVTAASVNTSIAVQRLDLIFGTLGGLTSGAQKVAVLWLGGMLALDGKLSAGMLMAFIAYADQFMSRCAAFIDYLIQLRLLKLQGERLADIVLTKKETWIEGAYAGPHPSPSVRFEGVGFRYAPSSPWVVRDLNFDVEAGTSVAITGPSGCGKSTVLRLLLGLLDAEEGRILIGGIDVRILGKQTVRTMMGAVLQDDVLLAGTMAENIAFFESSASLERVMEVARLAAIHTDIEQLPLGYNTPVGDMGAALSGGQRQRLLLARALYRRPTMLVLDEATSNLDVGNERIIVQNLRAFTGTRILVAHRPETIASADYVVSLHAVERGNHSRAKEAINA